MDTTEAIRLETAVSAGDTNTRIGLRRAEVIWPAKNGEAEAKMNARTKIEQHAADYVPEEERHSAPRKQAEVFIGAQMCFNLVILGWLPISFGLGWWSSASAIIVGLLIGVTLYGPYALFGPRTGTNGVVSSGAHFGVVGRLVGSLLLLCIALGFYALVIWAGGDAFVGAIQRLFDIDVGNGTRAVVYVAVGVASLLVATYGHDIVVAAQRFVVVVIGVLLLVGAIALWSKFDAGYQGGEYILGSFWSTWLLGVVTAIAVPISYGPFANDYSRYISLKKHSSRSIAIANGGGLFMGCWIVMTFGAYLGTMFEVKLGPVLGLISVSPMWFVVPVAVIGLLGALSHGSLCLYAPGIDIASLLPRLSRATTTAILGMIGIALVLLGAFVWDAVSAFSAFVVLFTICATPWMVINLMGYIARRGWYSPHDLQVLNRGQRGGLYWFTAGWNIRAMVAWVPAVVVGVLLSHTTVYTGPWANIAGGIDVSVPVAGVLGALIYRIALTAFPESPAVKGAEKVLLAS